ncbi:hypothetical protein DID88_006231 [Monilinia fructigena]|uniref:cutinase n=1 Tax=Monilinia fructigena TaxID=38457 RepID=A0A395J2G6_9HELO|nr:hypothetical protein DID88_006231 [Monilinia fructigena]
MKASAQQLLSLLLLPLSAIAAPAGAIEARACTEVTVIFARGTTETPTLGTQGHGKYGFLGLIQLPKHTKLVISGYSQGGQLVHNAAKQLPAATSAKIAAAVIFGDPDNGSPVQGVPASKTKIICHVGDNICEHGDMILMPHLTYGMDATAAASFVKQVAGS